VNKLRKQHGMVFKKKKRKRKRKEKGMKKKNSSTVFLAFMY